MKKASHPLLFTILFSLPGFLFSQNAAKELDKVYGVDQTLCNGKKYTYTVPASTKGHQFIISPDFIGGTVTLKGRCFTDLNLNYDVVNQQLLLQYQDDKGATTIIEISKAWLTAFHRGTMDFEYLSLGPEPHFYQVLGEGRFRILYYWSKKLVVNDVVGASNFVFTDALRDSFVLMDGQLKRFRTKRNLIRLFNEEKRPAIKVYLHKNKIKLSKASDKEMTDLITFIGTVK